MTLIGEKEFVSLWAQGFVSYLNEDKRAPVIILMEINNFTPELALQYLDLYDYHQLLSAYVPH